MPETERKVGERLLFELRNEGKTKVDLESEAHGDAEIAKAMIQLMADAAGVKVKTRKSSKSVTATVVTE